jgi:hypothetical protein
MNSKDRLNLKTLIDETNCEDNTETIRNVKHSVKIRNDIRQLERIKKNHSDLRKTDPEAFFTICQTQCIFLFNNYMDIFNKVYNDEIDLLIMTKLLSVLKLIEDKKVDQHEGSVLVGKLLKELYIDSALKRSDKLDKETKNDDYNLKVDPKPISWKEYKLQR